MSSAMISMDEGGTAESEENDLVFLLESMGNSTVRIPPDLQLFANKTRKGWLSNLRKNGVEGLCYLGIEDLYGTEEGVFGEIDSKTCEKGLDEHHWKKLGDQAPFYGLPSPLTRNLDAGIYFAKKYLPITSHFTSIMCATAEILSCDSKRFVVTTPSLIVGGVGGFCTNYLVDDLDSHDLLRGNDRSKSNTYRCFLFLGGTLSLSESDKDANGESDIYEKRAFATLICHRDVMEGELRTTDGKAVISMKDVCSELKFKHKLYPGDIVVSRASIPWVAELPFHGRMTNAKFLTWLIMPCEDEDQDIFPLCGGYIVPVSFIEDLIQNDEVLRDYYNEEMASMDFEATSIAGPSPDDEFERLRLRNGWYGREYVPNMRNVYRVVGRVFNSDRPIPYLMSKKRSYVENRRSRTGRREEEREALQGMVEKQATKPSTNEVQLDPNLEQGDADPGDDEIAAEEVDPKPLREESGPPQAPRGQEVSTGVIGPPQNAEANSTEEQRNERFSGQEEEDKSKQNESDHTNRERPEIQGSEPDETNEDKISPPRVALTPQEKHQQARMILHGSEMTTTPDDSPIKLRVTKRVMQGISEEHQFRELNYDDIDDDDIAAPLRGLKEITCDDAPTPELSLTQERSSAKNAGVSSSPMSAAVSRSRGSGMAARHKRTSNIESPPRPHTRKAEVVRDPEAPTDIAAESVGSATEKHALPENHRKDPKEVRVDLVQENEKADQDAKNVGTIEKSADAILSASTKAGNLDSKAKKGSKNPVKKPGKGKGSRTVPGPPSPVVTRARRKMLDANRE